MASLKEIQTTFETLKIVRKSSEDDFELRSSEDGKVWGVRMFDENPNKPTFVLYAGPDAKDLACDAADYEVDDEDSEEDDEEDDDDDAE